MNHPNLVDRYHCTGCLVCADSCSQRAIKMVMDDEGHYTYQVDEDKCVLCHRCEKVCPSVNKMEYGNNNLKLSQPYAAWATDEESRKRATSGGVFPAVAKTVIEQGGVVFGARQEQYYVHHDAIYNTEDIVRLQGSKYTQSKTEDIYRQVKKELDSGKRVLFTGLGCQVAALLSFLKENKNLDNLVTMDLICGGVPSTFLINKYIERCGQDFDSIVSYRTKARYELTVKYKDGTVSAIPEADRPLPIVGFTTGKAVRYCCYDCPFAKGHRSADITIGDYWGNTLFPEQKTKGVSVAVVHTEKGLNVLQRSDVEIHKIGWRDFLPFNPRMVYGKGYFGKDRINLANAFANYSFDKLQIIYGNGFTIKHPMSLVYKAMTIIRGRQTLMERKRIIKKILRDNNL